MTWPERPLALVMAYRGEGPDRCCGLALLAGPALRARLEQHAGPWCCQPEPFGETAYHPPGEAQLTVTCPADGIVLVEAQSWQHAREHAYRLLREQRASAMRTVQPYERFATAGGFEHYDGPYAAVPALSPDEALAMIDAAIEQAEEAAR